MHIITSSEIIISVLLQNFKITYDSDIGSSKLLFDQLFTQFLFPFAYIPGRIRRDEIESEFARFMKGLKKSQNISH